MKEKFKHDILYKMCYSVESSLKTTLISVFSIIYLVTSNIPHYQWLGITLIGWCAMQFDELLLWLTNPLKECTKWNKIITMTLIPLTLMLQPLAPLWGSLYVIPWKSSSTMRQYFLQLYTLLVIFIVSIIHFYKPEKICTTVTDDGHLNWLTNSKIIYTSKMSYIWGIMIILPLFLFWNKNLLLIILLCTIPAIGFIYGHYTDAQGSIWCYYTSYTSIIGSLFLFLQKNNMYHII